MLLYHKLINRSTFRQGFQILMEFHHLLKAMPNGMPQHWETRSVKVLIDDVGLDAQQKNQGFDRAKNTKRNIMQNCGQWIKKL